MRSVKENYTLFKHYFQYNYIIVFQLRESYIQYLLFSIICDTCSMSRISMMEDILAKNKKKHLSLNL